MFFKRERPKQITFDERMSQLKAAGFAVASAEGGRVRIAKDGCATIVENAPDGPRLIVRPGIEMGAEIGDLVDGGFQKFFQTPSGKRKPALAEELTAIQNFQEDLKETLGLISLYNESLGTTSTLYIYDRVQDRDRGVPKRVWEQ